MLALTPSVDLKLFFERVGKARFRVLMLDYDGTLAPFHVQPERAVPYSEARAVVQAIVQSGGTRVVIVSGRPADEIPPLLSLSEQPEIWGSHGWERLLPDGRRIVQEPDDAARSALSEAVECASRLTAQGARVETKIASVALHWRGLAPDAIEDVKQRARSLWAPLASDGGVEFLSFDGGLELRSVGCNKQYAVKAVLSETPPDSAVAYLGDDVTDEDAFRAVKTRGLAVLVRPEFRETGADVWLRPPKELVQFLQPWAVRIGI